MTEGNGSHGEVAHFRKTVATLWAEEFNTTVKKLSDDNFPFDYADIYEDGEVIAFLEIRRRKFDFGDETKEIYLPLKKFTYLCSWAFSGVNICVVVGFNDRVAFCRVSDIEIPRIVLHGDYDTPMVVVERDHWQLVSEVTEGFYDEGTRSSRNRDPGVRRGDKGTGQRNRRK